mgnify:CR=1 FL=1
MKLLELFAGSRSIGKEAERQGFEVFSVDINNFKDIDLVIDILDLKKEMIPFSPDVIWASPPCTYFSVASIGHHWNKDDTPKTKEALLGLDILHKTLDIFNWFPNAIFFMENPRGKMRKKIKGINRATVTYCSYATRETKVITMKPTDIWSNHIYDIFNKKGWNPRPICFNGNTKCSHEEAPRGSRTGVQGLNGNYERSKIPVELCKEIIESIKK